MEQQVWDAPAVIQWILLQVLYKLFCGRWSCSLTVLQTIFMEVQLMLPSSFFRSSLHSNISINNKASDFCSFQDLFLDFSWLLFNKNLENWFVMVCSSLLILYNKKKLQLQTYCLVFNFPYVVYLQNCLLPQLAYCWLNLSCGFYYCEKAANPHNQVAHINCGNCRTTLMYPYGAPSVKCAVCQFVTNVGVSLDNSLNLWHITHTLSLMSVMKKRS